MRFAHMQRATVAVLAGIAVVLICCLAAARAGAGGDDRPSSPPHTPSAAPYPAAFDAGAGSETVRSETAASPPHRDADSLVAFTSTMARGGNAGYSDVDTRWLGGWLWNPFVADSSGSYYVQRAS